MISNRLPADVLSASLYQLLPYCFAAMKSPIRAASSCRTSCQTINISELGQIGDHSDATCDASNRDVYEYVEVKEHRMLLSQRREMPQLHTKIPEGLDTPRGFVAFNGAPDKI